MQLPPLRLVATCVVEMRMTPRTTQLLRTAVALLGFRRSRLTGHPRSVHPIPTDPQKPIIRPHLGRLHPLTLVVVSTIQVQSRLTPERPVRRSRPPPAHNLPSLNLLQLVPESLRACPQKGTLCFPL